MPKVKVYNQAGKEVKEVELSDAIFGVQPKADVVHQVYTALTANARAPWANTKDRSEVSGGGKKPWKQKGTGRARHGSIRSPIWKGGGVTFGPLSERSYKQKINKKMNALAVKMCLSDKVLDGKLIVLENFNVDGKAKTVAAIRALLPGKGRTAMFIPSEKNDALRKAATNVAKTAVARAMDINVVDLLHYQYIITTPDAVTVLEKRLK